MWKKISLHLFFLLTVIMAFIGFLFATHSGLLVTSALLEWIIPGHYHFQKIQGSWLKGVNITQFEYHTSNITLLAKEITFNLKSLEIKEGTLKHPLFQLPFIAKGALKNKIFIFSLDIPNTKIPYPNLEGTINAHLDFYQKLGTALQASGELTLSPGIFKFLNPENKLKNIHYLGGKANITLEKNDLAIDYTFQENKNNFLNGILNITIPSGSLTGFLTANFKNLDVLYAILPQLSRLNAGLSLNGKFQGTLKSPLLSLTAKTTPSSFYLIKQAVFVDNLKISIDGALPGELNIQGQGRSGAGSFQLQGTCNTVNDPLQLLLNIQGKNTNIYNTHHIHLNASPQVALTLSKNLLKLDGTLAITEGNIILQSDKSNVTISQDIVIIDSNKPTTNRTLFKIIPNLYLITENKLHFKGYGLDAIMSGKLAVSKRPDGLMAAHGRLTIKEGKYRLQGATRYIQRGYLLFPPGTLLNDPVLDIRILQKTAIAPTSNDIGIYVQGTLQKPILSPFSNTNLQNEEILSKLGFGNTQSPTTETERQLISQSAFLLAGTTNPFIEHLQENFGLEEFNLESREIQKNYITQGATDTVLVIGKPLSTKLYVQYIQSVLEPISLIRLKYALTPHVTTSFETGTEGLGGDLIFSWERD